MEPRVFTKGVLKSVNTMAHVQGYNRIVDEKFLDRLPDEKFYVPNFVLLHEHKAGKLCDPHVRCVFDHEGDYFIIDVEMGCWEKLPTASEMARMIRHVETRRAEGDVYV
jgi:hypothetical protein